MPTILYSVVQFNDRKFSEGENIYIRVNVVCHCAPAAVKIKTSSFSGVEITNITPVWVGLVFGQCIHRFVTLNQTSAG